MHACVCVHACVGGGGGAKSSLPLTSESAVHHSDYHFM